MNRNFPVYTLENSCQDCYKCVRRCPTKSIKVIDGSASVIPSLCVSCGKCVEVCPAGAKKIRNDISIAKYLLKNKTKIIASVAPSWINSFTCSEQQFIIGLKKLGFDEVSETAIGAQIVSSATHRILHESKENDIFISSACPSAVSYIKKFNSEYGSKIMDIGSPLQIHARFLHKQYQDEDIAVVFFGPCIAKKNEADRDSDLIGAALTFENLQDWLAEEKIDLNQNLDDISNQQFYPFKAEEGCLYPLEGGMIETIKGVNDIDDDIIYLQLSGLYNIENFLKEKVMNLDKKVFIECLACESGCINGPAVGNKQKNLNDLINIASYRNEYRKLSIDRNVEIPVAEHQNVPFEYELTPSAELIRKKLALIGKTSLEDELNCSGCGYQTCQDFAKALIHNKAEVEMCVSYMRQLAQKQANALIRYIPAGVVIVDKLLNIIECNRHYAKLFDESNLLAFEAVPGLRGIPLKKTLPLAFAKLFATVLESGGELIRDNFVCDNEIYEIKVFTIEENFVIGAIIQNITNQELQREQIAEKARAVISKNIQTVQRVANCLGEHMAETEILLREVASGYQKEDSVKDIKIYDK
ncbi:[Fe-Fe] hydrogenase large subunit C-terminal domain-containing protein [Lentisphaerota bacterium WC36G]|nr:4Fe-4S binding protein [Lentisphaerae bacterium WC36]